MILPDWFDDLPTLGQLPPAQAAAKLRELGEDQAADVLAAAARDRPPEVYGPGWWPFQDRPWQHTAHAIGHLAPSPHSDEAIPVRDASAIQPDPSLKGARLKVTLGRLYAADYPGRGTHRVLVDVAARDQTAPVGEQLHFAATYQVREGEAAGVAGYPVFLGLPVGDEGLVLGLATVNVGNEADEHFLATLESETFKAGLRLVQAWQPALAPLSELVLGLTKAIARRARNVAIQKFTVGLDFRTSPGGLRLAEGTYLAVQIPEELGLWDWDEWVYHPRRGRLVSSADPAQPIPFNYVMVGVDRYDGK
jgi:hypothetical protein